MLDKPEFDCTNLGSFYDCGCAEEDAEGTGSEGAKKDGTSSAPGANAQGSGQSNANPHDHLAVEISKEASVLL